MNSAHSSFPLRLAIVGCGEQMLDNLLPAILMLRNCVIVAICEINLAQLEKVPVSVRRYAQHYTDYEEMLDTTELDAIIVAASPQLHFDISRAALARRVSTWVEKPPCTCRSDLLKLVELAQEHGKTTGVGVNYQWAPAMQGLRELLNSREFGKPLRAEIRHSADKPRSAIWGLGSTLESFNLAQTIHSIHMGVVLGKGEIINVTTSCQRRRINGGGELLFVDASIEFRNGFVCVIRATNGAPCFNHSISVLTDQSVEVSVDGLALLRVADSNCQLGKRAVIEVPRSPVKEHSRGFREQLEAFMESVAANEPYAADFESLLPTYGVLEQISSSWDAGTQHVAWPTDSSSQLRDVAGVSHRIAIAQRLAETAREFGRTMVSLIPANLPTWMPKGTQRGIR